MKYATVCSGIEAPSVAWKDLGWEAQWFSEIDNFPSAVLKYHYPNIPNLGDMTKLTENRIFQESEVDLIIGGTPCFSSNTLVVTDKGLVPISEIRAGDNVYTHQNRFRKVLKVGVKFSDTIIVKGQGSSGINTTENHPFYAREEVKTNWRNGRTFGDIKWIEAKDLKDKFWCTPIQWPNIGRPQIIVRGNIREEDLAWLLGRWLSDGWCRIGKRRSYVLISCEKHNFEAMKKKLDEMNFKFRVLKQRTTIRFQICDSALAKWVRNNFGKGASEKTIPIWLLGWEHRDFFFEGYLSADKNKCKNGFKASTTSKKMSIGLMLLAHSLNVNASISCSVSSPTKIIKGSQKPQYVISFCNDSKSSIVLDGYRFGKVKNILKGEPQNVWNIEVEEDNSYVADGLVVHNCQSFSVAGLRKGLDDERGNLSLEFVRILKAKRPKYFIWENVPGVFSSGGGEDFKNILRAFAEIGGYGLAWRVLDARYFGVPQKRRRVFVVGCLGDWQSAAKILFEPESLRRDIKKGRKKREETARDAEESVGSLCARSCRSLSVQDCMQGHIRAEKIDVICFEPGAMSRLGGHIFREYSSTLRAYAGDNQQCVAFDNTGFGAYGNGKVFSTVKARDCKGATDLVVDIKKGYSVRRLTPVEVERLQGFPDSYTNIPYKKKPDSPDSCRYKAVGNSMAVPVIRWIGKRIQMLEDGLL